jgi:5-methylcytosine-specific restriction endonuclease McrA
MPRKRETPWHDPWRGWYQLERWRRLRRAQLRREPLCAQCLSRDVVTAAEVADHVVHHAGDWNAFLTGKLQSLCAACHAEKHGRLRVPIGIDGWGRVRSGAGGPVPPRATIRD